jgi:four helix bundle protein
MVAKTIEELLAYQLAGEFKDEVYHLVNGCGQPVDFKYRSQLFDAAAGVQPNIREGFDRNKPGEFAQFLRYALGSLGEACTRVLDGVDRGYFTRERCDPALRLGKRCRDVTRALHRSVEEYRRKQLARRDAGRSSGRRRS